jgi:hypothetical protein
VHSKKEFPKAANTHTNGYPRASGNCLTNWRKLINTRGFPKPFNMSTGGFQGLFNDGWNNYIFLPFQHTVANIRKNSTNNQANRAKASELKMVFYGNISTYNCKLLLNIIVTPLDPVGEIGSVHSSFEIMIALGLQNPMLNRNRTQILNCMVFIDLLDGVVTGY